VVVTLLTIAGAAAAGICQTAVAELREVPTELVAVTLTLIISPFVNLYGEILSASFDTRQVRLELEQTSMNTSEFFGWIITFKEVMLAPLAEGATLLI